MARKVPTPPGDWSAPGLDKYTRTAMMYNTETGSDFDPKDPTDRVVLEVLMERQEYSENLC